MITMKMSQTEEWKKPSDDDNDEDESDGEADEVE